MIVEIILAVAVAYLWVFGGLFLAIGACDADFRTTTWRRVVTFIAVWPFIIAFAAVFEGWAVLRRLVRA